MNLQGPLKRGDKGDPVGRVQQMLSRLGYLRAAFDGTFGPRTLASVLAYQIDNGLDADGICGPRTLELLERHATEFARSTGTYPRSLDISGLVHCPSPGHDARPAGARVDTAVVHATELGLSDSLKTLAGAGARVSTHFVVARSGRVLQLVDPRRRAWHAGRSRWQERSDVNDFSIGIDAEFVTRIHDGYTDEQYLAIARLVWELAREFPIVLRNVVGHEDVAVPTGRKRDPGPRFDWERLRRLLGLRGTIRSVGGS